MADAIAGEPPVPAPTRRRILVPFAIVTLIWGSTWIVIRSQQGVVPTGWSVAYRFTIAAMAMLAYARWSGAALRVARGDLPLLVAIALCQFVLNFHFVYHAEAHVTSGVVAMVFALLVVPNAILGRIFLGAQLSRPFLLGSLVALGGIALLFDHELKAAGGGSAQAALGIGLTIGGVLSASAANVMQAGARARALPMATLLGWVMLIAAMVNIAFALATAGPPRFDPRPAYWAGVLYLGLAASALAFPLYFGVIRAIGPGRAAYSSVIVPVIAMALSTAFEGYRWSAESLVGGALVFAGLIFALRSRSPRAGG